MEAAERAQKVYELKLRGTSFPDIARALNISHRSAVRCFERVFQKVPPADVHCYRTQSRPISLTWEENRFVDGLPAG